jgi:hypothetical protein
MFAGLRDLARAETETNVRVLIELRDSKKTPAAVRVAAIRELFDRGYGRPLQARSMTPEPSERQDVDEIEQNRED